VDALTLASRLVIAATNTIAAEATSVDWRRAMRKASCTRGYLERKSLEHCASFIRNPAAVLEEVRQTMLASQMDQNDLNDRIASLDSILTGKLSERARVINLVRRGLD